MSGSGASSPDKVRVVSRLAAGYLLRCVNISCACIDPDISTAMVFLSVMLGNVAPHLDDWTETRAFAGLETQTPDGIREPMSVQSVAESLGVPFETVRRRVRRLRDLGLLASSTKGLVVAPGAMARPGLKRLVLEASAVNEDLVDDALRLGLMNPPDPIDEDVRRQSARLSARFLLDSIHLMRRATKLDTVPALIVRAVLLANVAHLNDDLLTRRLFGSAAALPPDSERHPVSAYAVAKILMLPYETVRRHSVALAKSGRLKRVGKDGLIVAAEWAGRPEILQSIPISAALTDQLLQDLSKLGVGSHVFRKAATG